MGQQGRKRRERRAYTDEFRAGAVRLVLDEGKSISQVARDLDLTPSALRVWVERARADRSKGKIRGSDDRGAPGARAPAQGGPRAADRARHPKKSGGLLRQREQLKFSFVAAEKAHLPVSKLCKALHVSRAGFYAWASREESARAVEDRHLELLVRDAHTKSRCTYGSPRVQADLRAKGIVIGRKRVMRIMRSAGLRGRVHKRYRRYTTAEHDQPIADNLLARDFAATKPNEKWVSDTTELAVEGGRIFLAVVLDLFARVVVGWSVSAVNDRHLVIKALDEAVRRRCPDAGLLHHSDQGSPYTSEDYQKALGLRGITCSMSRRGNCYDNAAMESWFATLKAELGERFQNHRVAKDELFDYIEIFYNQQRRHSALGYATPAEHERAERERQVA